MRFLMFLGIVFVVGMLVLGDNPVREFQRKQKEILSKYGNDDLTIRTNLYIEQQKANSTLGTEERAEPASATSMLNSIKSSSAEDNSVNPDSSGIAVKVAEPDDALPEDISVEVNGNDSGSPVKREAEKNIEKANNYYPPIIGQTNEMASQQKPVILTGKEPKLRSGQAIAFEGTSVYIIDNNGYKKPMPDGIYNMQDGSRITVSNGRSMMR